MPDLSCTMQNLLVTACEPWPGTEECSDCERTLVPLPWFMRRWFYTPLPPCFVALVQMSTQNTKYQEWEDRTQTGRRYFQNLSNKNSYLNFTKEFLNEITGNQTTWLRNRQKIWIDTKDDTWMINKHMKRCSTSCVIREFQIKTTRCYCTPARMVKVQDADSLHMQARVWNQSKSCFISGGNAKWYCHFGRPFGGFLQN